MGYVYKNVYGVLAVQDEATINEPKVIRFIDPHYRERFTIHDGDQILIRYADGEKRRLSVRLSTNTTFLWGITATTFVSLRR